MRGSEHGSPLRRAGVLSALGAAVLALVLGLLAPAASAEEARAAADAAAAVQRLQLQLQRLSAERARLTSELDTASTALEAAEASLEAVTAERDALQRQTQADERRIGGLENANAQFQERVEQLGERLQEIIDQYREAVATLQEMRADRDNWQTIANGHESRIAICEEQNNQLYDISQEALERYENKGCLSRFAQLEPFTQIKRVQIEHMVEDYRRLLDELYIDTTIEDEVPEGYPGR